MHPADLIPRLATSAVLAPAVLLAVLLLPDTWFALVCWVLAALVLWEWLALSGLRSLSFRVVWVASLAGGCWVMWRDATGWTLIGVWIGLSIWLGALIWLGHSHFCAGYSKVSLSLKAAVGWALSLAMFAALLWVSQQAQGRLRVLYLVAMICTLDTLCYLLGKYVPRLRRFPLIAPTISPNKNFGVLVVAALITSMIGAAILLFDPWGATAGQRVLLFVAAMSALPFGVVGDLFSSLMKRHALVKDSGQLLPGHGGVVDRLDSLLAALPVFVAVQFFML